VYSVSGDSVLYSGGQFNLTDYHGGVSMRYALIAMVLLAAPLAYAGYVKVYDTAGVAGDGQGISDTHFYRNYQLENNTYGGTGLLNVRSSGTFYDNNHRALIGFDDWASWYPQDSTLDSAFLTLTIGHIHYGDRDLWFYPVFKPWTEANCVGCNPAPGDDGATYQRWGTDGLGGDGLWGKYGCDSVDDNGSDNSGDGTGPDRWETPIIYDNDSIASRWPQELRVNITPFAEEWHDGTLSPERGIIIIMDTTVFDSRYLFYSSNYTASTRPYVEIYYSPDGAPPPDSADGHIKGDIYIKGDIDIKGSP
jgi:hypothetical protein